MRAVQPLSFYLELIVVATADVDDNIVYPEFASDDDKIVYPEFDRDSEIVYPDAYTDD